RDASSVKTVKLATSPAMIASGRLDVVPVAPPASRIGSTGSTHGENAVIRPAASPMPIRTSTEVLRSSEGYGCFRARFMMAFVVGVGWATARQGRRPCSYAGIRARPRTLHRAAQRGPTAQASLWIELSVRCGLGRAFGRG